MIKKPYKLNNFQILLHYIKHIVDIQKQIKYYHLQNFVEKIIINIKI